MLGGSQRLQCGENSICTLNQFTFGWILYGAVFCLQSQAFPVCYHWPPVLSRGSRASCVLWACFQLCWATVSDLAISLLESFKAQNKKRMLFRSFSQTKLRAAGKCGTFEINVYESNNYKVLFEAVNHLRHDLFCWWDIYSGLIWQTGVM